MTFQQLLASIVDDTPGAIAAAIMGSDGLAVEEYALEAATAELPAMVVEFQRVFDDARKVVLALGTAERNGLEELLIVTQRHQLLLRPIDDEYALALLLEPHGLMGKARYRIRTLLRELREAL